MKRHLFALLSGALLLSGCTALQPSTSVHMVASNQPTFIDMDASRRGVVILPRANGQGYQFCAEPSPDVALEAVTRILAEAKTNGSNIDAKAEAEFRTAVVQLSKTQTSIRVNFLDKCHRNFHDKCQVFIRDKCQVGNRPRYQLLSIL